MPEALERAEAAAFRDLARAAPASFGAEVLDVAGAMCLRVDALRPERMFNRVIGLGLGGAVADEELAAIDEFYGGDGYMVSLAPAAGLDDLLHARGFTDGYAWMRFRRDTEPLEPIAPDLRLVRGPAEDFSHVVHTAFGMPEAMRPWLEALCDRDGWECWVAYEGDRPAGAGALFAHDDVAWLGLGGTLPEMRGRGAQGALLAHRVRRAFELGARRATTETGVAREGEVGPSYRNIVRAGFTELYVRPNLLAPA